MRIPRTVQALTMAAVFVASVFAQAPPPMLPPPQLDQLTARIALYPDPLITQILAAATYSDQIAPAAQWADQHHYLTGPALASAIQADQLPWDPSVQALLPFPSVLEMMAGDMNWTAQLGNAFLAQQADVMDSIQRNRRMAYQYGYLRTNPQITVGYGPYITIMPVNPGFIVVPYYDPAVVFFPPRPGFAIGGAISFGFGINIGVAFRPWGWGVGRFDWGAHRVFINDHVWGRTWANRTTYVHAYEGVRRPAPGAVRPAEGHEVHERSPAERDAARRGMVAPREEHRDGKRR